MRTYIAILFSLAIVFAFTTVSFSQGPPPPSDVVRHDPSEAQRGGQGMQELLRRQLGLSQDQLTRLREINRQGRPQMQEANRALRDANRELDLAIYADEINEALIAERVARFQQAQAKVAELRFKGELEIRKLLTPEQLVKFRELRERAEKRREEVRDEIQRRRPDNQPNRPRPLRPRQE